MGLLLRLGLTLWLCKGILLNLCETKVAFKFDIFWEEKTEPVEPGWGSQSSAGAAVDAAEPVGSSRTPEH